MGHSVASHCNLDIVCAEPETSIGRLRMAFRDPSVDAVVVLDPMGAPLGIVTAQDFIARGDHAAAVKDVMTSRSIAVEASDSLAHAAELMKAENIQQLIVLGWGGAVIGLLSAVDVLRGLGSNGSAKLEPASR